MTYQLSVSCGTQKQLTEMVVMGKKTSLTAEIVAIELLFAVHETIPFLTNQVKAQLNDVGHSLFQPGQSQLHRLDL